jgi:transposase
VRTPQEILTKPDRLDEREFSIMKRHVLDGAEILRRTPDITLLEIQQRLVANCGEHFSVSVLWRFFDRHGITFKKNGARRGAATFGRVEEASGMV